MIKASLRNSSYGTRDNQTYNIVHYLKFSFEGFINMVCEGDLIQNHQNFVVGSKLYGGT